MSGPIGLVPNLSNLADKVTQAEAFVQKTSDVMNGVTGPNGLKIPGGASLQKLLGSLPTGISTISTVAQSFTAASQSLSRANGLGGFLNSAIGTAQTLAGAVSSVVGAAASLGIDVGALGGLSEKLVGVNPSTSSAPASNFSMTPKFQWELSGPQIGYTFPSDLGSKMEKIQLSIKVYEKGKMTQSPTYTPQDSIFLPLPRDLNEDHSPHWAEYSPGPIRAIVKELLEGVNYAADNATNDGAQNISSFQNWITSKVTDLSGSLSNFTKSGVPETVPAMASLAQLGLYAIGGQGTNTVNMLSNFTGRTVNPYTTVAFQGVGLRQHNFVWFLAPKTPAESAQLHKIFNILRMAALPRNMQGAFLEYPKIVSVRFVPKEHFNFKPCVINSLRINHAGSGQPSFFNETGDPTIYILQLSLKEIEMYTSNDVGVASEDVTSIIDWNAATFFNIDGDDTDAIFGR